ncbi:MAG: hypothetical protein D6775_14915, partial [Caldilineae bacterium]
QVREQVQELLRLWLEQNQTSPDERDMAAAAATWAIYGLAQHWARARSQASLNEYVERILPLVMPLLGITVERHA